MEYTTLKKLYYTDIDKYEEEYVLRSTCPFTRYIGIKLTKDMYRILLESGMMYGQGVTIMKLSELLGKSRNTIQSRLNDINSTHILVYTSQKKKYYKLNMKVFRII